MQFEDSAHGRESLCVAGAPPSGGGIAWGGCARRAGCLVASRRGNRMCILGAAARRAKAEARATRSVRATRRHELPAAPCRRLDDA
eukprot:3124836-Pyramimonas_sp.AAC.1